LSNTALLTFPPKPTLSIDYRAAVLLLGSLLIGVLAGCDQPAPIRQYTISTEVPAALRSDDRMLAAIVPGSDRVWFFKVVGPTEAVDFAEPELRPFLTQIQFVNGEPDLATLPSGWNRQKGEREFRFATITIPTPPKELELTISNLPKTGQWDDQVAMNVNRWRGQMKLTESTERWAGAQPLTAGDAADETAVWVDLTGTMGSGPASMAAMAAAPFASRGGMSGELPPGHPEIPAPGSPATSTGPRSDTEPRSDGQRPSEASSSDAANRNSAAEQSRAGGDNPPENPGGLQYEAPADWRSGKMSMMRMAAFEIGPEDRSAELTIIQAGGDLRGNVDRWLGQVLGDSPDSEVVDAALEDAERLQVSGRDAQRYYLTAGESSAADAQAIDATIVPLEGGMSLFIKATGPANTLQEQRSAIGQFLQSLSLPE
jgi:hypothetical protein